MHNHSSFCLDANALITPWYILYPPKIFPTLWEELAKRRGSFIIIKPIFDEIEPYPGGHKPNTTHPDCPLRNWLINKDFKPELNLGGNEMHNTLFALEKNYDTRRTEQGIGKNDAHLIAYAKVHGNSVVTYEEIQDNAPREKRNYKIPLVCKTEGVACITFIKMLEELGVRI